MPLTQLWATITILAVSICSYSQCDNLLPTSTTGQIIHHTYYCLSYAEDHEQAEWTYNDLTRDLIDEAVGRIDDFREFNENGEWITKKPQDHGPNLSLIKIRDVMKRDDLLTRTSLN